MTATARISEQLRSIRQATLLAEPEDFNPNDDAAIGREINEFRILLGRLNAVHTSGGRVTGWGHLEDQRPRVPTPPPVTTEPAIEIPTDEDEDEPSQRPARSRRARSGTTS